MTTKLTRQFNTDNPAALRRDLFRLCDELGSAIARLDARIAALELAAGYVPSLCVVKATTVSVTATEAAIAFSSEAVIDTDGYHNASVNNTRLTAPEDGVYEVVGTINDNDASTAYEIRLRRDGSGFLGAGGSTGTLNDSGAIARWEGALDAGQYFELLVDNSGTTSLERASFLMRRLDR